MTNIVNNDNLNKVTGGADDDFLIYKVKSNKETINDVAQHLQKSVSVLHSFNPELIKYGSNYLPVGTQVKYKD